MVLEHARSFCERWDGLLVERRGEMREETKGGERHEPNPVLHSVIRCAYVLISATRLPALALPSPALSYTPGRDVMVHVPAVECSAKETIHGEQTEYAPLHDQPSVAARHAGKDRVTRVLRV